MKFSDSETNVAARGIARNIQIYIKREKEEREVGGRDEKVESATTYTDRVKRERRNDQNENSEFVWA